MANHIQDNRVTIKRQHYLLLANQVTHWFNASPVVLAKYRRLHGNGFCLVLWRSGPDDDAYVIPFERIAHLLTKENLIRGSANYRRWHGGIRSGRFTLRGTSESAYVADCHNAFHLLDQ